MPDVTLTIKVKDGEVKDAEAGLKRLEKAANDLSKSDYGLRLTRSGMAPNEDERQRRLAAFMSRDMPDAAKKAVQSVQSAGNATEVFSTKVISSLKQVAGSLSGVGSGFINLVGAAGPAALAIGAIVLVVGGAVHELSALAKEFASSAMEAKKMAEQMGLASGTIAGLKLEFEAQGRSIKDLTGPLSDFRKLIGEAAAGNLEARQTLVSLGLDGSKSINNIDVAFRQALTTIAATQSPVDKVRLATNAFGADGARILIPFLKDAHGNLDEMTKQASRFGTQISGQGLKDAQDYTRAVANMDAAFDGLKNTIGGSVLPALTEVANKLTETIQMVKANPWLFAGGIAAGGLPGLTAAWVISDLRGPQSPQQLPRPGSREQIEGRTPTASAVVDIEALQAQQAEQKRLADEALKDQQRTIEAKIQALEIYAASQTDVFKRTVKSIEDEFARTDDVKKFQASIESVNQWMLVVVKDAYQQMDKLEDDNFKLSKHNAAERALLDAQQLERRKKLAQAVYDAEAERDKLIAAADKKSNQDILNRAQQLAEEYIRIKLAEKQQLIALNTAVNQGILDENTRFFDIGLRSEGSYVAKINEIARKELADRRDLIQTTIDAIEETISTNSNPIIQNTLKKKFAGQLESLKGQIKVADQQLKNQTDNPQMTRASQIEMAIRAIHNVDNNERLLADRRHLAAVSEQLSLEQQISALQDDIANGGVNDALKIQAAHLQDVLDLRNRELDAVIAINRAQLELAHSMEISNNQIRAGVYEHLAAASNLNNAIVSGINNTFDAISSQMDKQLDKLNDWSHGMLSFITEPLKAIAHKQLSDLFSGVLDSIFPGAGLGDLAKQTNNPVARPIVDEIKTTNALLSQLVRSTGQVPAAGAGIGGLLGGLLGIGGSGSGGGLGTIFGGSAGGGIYNLGGGGGGGLVLNTGNLPGAPGSPSNPNGGLLGRLGNIFSSRPGGIFAPPTNPITGQPGSRLTGYLSGAGSLAQLAGGLIGGRAGGFLSNIGSGISIGAQIGSIIPGIGTLIGAGIGAAVGFFASLFGGDPKKKRDRDEKIPALTKGFTDAFTELNSILADIRALRIDPDEAVSRATAVRNQIASGFGIQFESKKYRKESQQQIATRLVEADRIINEIKSDAAIARGAADRTKRILPEFAGGTYFADFFRPNGLIPGMFDGRDDIMAMISRGEMVLNPAQQNRVRSIAGGDVFAHAGIPNYPRASTSPRLATGGIAGPGLALAAQPTNITVQPRFTVVLQGDVFDERASAYLQGDDGRRVQAKVVSQLKLSRDI